MHDQLLADRYRLLRPLGAGGAAEVWLARDELLQVDRAIKIIAAEEAARPTARRRLRAEARAIASIAHPNVLRMLDVGEIDGRDYLVMELSPGGSLADRVLRDGPMPVAEAVERTVEALAGLAAAHAVGIVHRDVKPPNILIAQDGRAILADFGIALVGSGERRTREGVSMGSFAFMPPEQRLDARSVDPRADLYAVGASLFWLVTGRTPVDLFAAEPDSPRFADLDPELVDAIRWATRLEPEDRPRSAADLAARLLALAPEVSRHRPDLRPADFPEPSVGAGTLDAPFDVGHAVAERLAEAATPLGDRRRARRRLATAALLMTALLALAVFVTLGRRPVAMDVPIAPISPLGGEGAVAPTGPVHDAWDPIVIVAPRRPGRPLAEARPLARSWRGTFGARPCALRLRGDDGALRGELVVSFGEASVSTPVAGTYDPRTGVARLRDRDDGPDAGTYDLALTGGALRGTFRARHRDASLPVLLNPVRP